MFMWRQTTEQFLEFFLVGNILSAIGHLNGERVRELLFYLIFARSLNIIYFAVLHDSKGCAWFLAACHRTPCRTRLGTIVFVVHGLISRLNKNPNACSGRSKQPGYAYRMLKRRRKLFKEGYKFDPKTREWVKG
ncbi:hypothetical protein ES706_03454 [subsurface metagenome]